MSVRVQLDNPHSYYTNLEFISGKIILHLTKDENISAIIVKLEGESKTVLMRPMIYGNSHMFAGGPLGRGGGPPFGRGEAPFGRGGGNQRQQLASENHKVLYKAQQVFPTQEPAGGATMGLAYTLRPGQHEYPFRFKIPFNNGCFDPAAQQMGPGTGFAGLGLGGLQQLQYGHVKKTLPPSLTGFPGEAEIRYYVKVTVHRSSIFKENRRSAIGFKFMPVEPPRPPLTSHEVYARRPHQFQAGLAPYAKKSSMFQKKPTKMSDTAPKLEIDARLPSPPVLTCNQPIPLRILGRKMNESAETAFVTSLQIHLFGFTEVRAQDVSRTELSTWVLMSLAGLQIPIVLPSDKVGTETVIENKYWDQIRLPNTVAPSFHTCNITRRYEVEVRVGLGYGVTGEVQPQSIVLPLRFQVEVFSGISPPAALLDAMAQHPPPQHAPAHVNTPAVDPAYPPQLGAGNAPSAEDMPPPSYEDAMAEEFTQPDGPRPAYSGVTNENAPSEVGEKGGPPPNYGSGPRPGGGPGAAGGRGSGPSAVV